MPRAVAGVSLVRTAQWAATILGVPDFSMSSADTATLEAFVRRAELHAGTSRSRRVDPFADPHHDGKGTVIGNTLRWFWDLSEPEGTRVPQRLFMKRWHEYSWAKGDRKSHNRSSFWNNVGPYCRMAGALLRVDHVPVLKDDGTPVIRKDYAPKTTPYVVWRGPTPHDWLAVMLDSDLDSALAFMERRLMLVDSDPDEASLTKRWHDHVRGEIVRRAS